MEKIELKLDESNELIFRVAIEGTNEKPSSIRFVCEDSDLSYMFAGKTGEHPGEILVAIPPMDKRMKDGVYEGRLEVIIEGKCISPLQVLTQFKPGVKIVAESVKHAEPAKLDLKVSASVSVASRKAETVERVREAATPTLRKPMTLAERYTQTKSKS